jgi:hypothetical protein
MFKELALAAIAAVAVAAIGVPAYAQEVRPQTAQAPAAPAVLATGQDVDDPDLQCDILEVKRVSGGALSIRWRLTNTAGGGQTGLTGATTGKTITYDIYHADYNVYYIDPAENKKYTIIRDSNGARIAQIFSGDLAPGQQKLSWAKFAAPPASSTKVSLTIFGFAPFEDLPISQ